MGRGGTARYVLQGIPALSLSVEYDDIYLSILLSPRNAVVGNLKICLGIAQSSGVLIICQRPNHDLEFRGYVRGHTWVHVPPGRVTLFIGGGLIYEMILYDRGKKTFAIKIGKLFYILF